MSAQTDLELIQAFTRGEAACFNELVRRYQEKVYWIARRVLGTHEDADDVVQDVFVRVYERLKDFRGDSGFYTWLYRITINVSLNALRKKRAKDFVQFDKIEDLLESHMGSADAATLHNEYVTILEEAIKRLPEKQKLVFTMRYYDEVPYEEMSKILNKSVGGLKANYFHALKKIQAYVKNKSNS